MAVPPVASTDRCRLLLQSARAVLDRLPDQDVRAAFVFGSAAWGDADEASDVDLMVLLDRPGDFREVARIRTATVLGEGAPGPLFVDVDRVSADRFLAATGRGAWANRLVRSVILRDTDGFLEAIRARATARHLDPPAVASRLAERRQAADAHRSAMWTAVLTGDGDLAALHGRLAAEDAAKAVVEAGGGRYSTTHFVDGIERALRAAGDPGPMAGASAGLGLDDAGGRRAEGPLAAPFAARLGAEHVPDTIRRGLEGYARLAEALRQWMRDTAVANSLPPEDAAWAEFTYGEETYDEIGLKVAAFLRAGRAPAAAYYVDCLLLVGARMNLGKVLMLRTAGSPRIPAPAEFHAALRQCEPALFEAWVRALRLEAWMADPGPWRLEAGASRLLAAAEGLVRAGAPSAARAEAETGR